MKIKVLLLTACLVMGFQYLLFAGMPCTNQFALGYAQIEATYISDQLFCREALFTGPCLDEAEHKYEDAYNNLVSQFSACCCINNLPYCCN